MSNLIDRFAPYPKTEDEATAENVYRYLLVGAFITNLSQVRPFQQPGDHDQREHFHGVARFVAEWSTLHLMRHLMRYQYPDGFAANDPAINDQVARDMWIGWEDGGGPAEALWEWLVEAGFSPEEIEKAYDEATAGK